jgi:hypothetical protein
VGDSDAGRSSCAPTAARPLPRSDTARRRESSFCGDGPEAPPSPQWPPQSNGCISRSPPPIGARPPDRRLAASRRPGHSPPGARSASTRRSAVASRRGPPFRPPGRRQPAPCVAEALLCRGSTASRRRPPARRSTTLCRGGVGRPAWAPQLSTLPLRPCHHRCTVAGNWMIKLDLPRAKVLGEARL